MSTQNTQPGDKAVMDQVALMSFVERIIAERNDPAVTPEKLPAVKAKVLEEMNEALNRHLIDRLSEEDKQALAALLDSNPSDEGLNKFFIEKIPSIDVEIASALLTFRNAYIAPILQEGDSGSAQEQAVSTDASDELPPLTPAPVEA